MVALDEAGDRQAGADEDRQSALPEDGRGEVAQEREGFTGVDAPQVAGGERLGSGGPREIHDAGRQEADVDLEAQRSEPVAGRGQRRARPTARLGAVGLQVGHHALRDEVVDEPDTVDRVIPVTPAMSARLTGRGGA